MGGKIPLYMSGVRDNAMQNQHANLANNTCIKILIINKEDDFQSGDNLNKPEEFTSNNIKRKVNSLESEKGDNQGKNTQGTQLRQNSNFQLVYYKKNKSIKLSKGFV